MELKKIGAGRKSLPPINILFILYIDVSYSGAPEGIRTPNPRFRRPMLCPLSYRRATVLNIIAGAPFRIVGVPYTSAIITGTDLHESTEPGAYDMTQPDKPETPNAEDKYAPLMEQIRKFSESISESDLEKIPTDLSENLDYYLYGTPKKSNDES